MSDASETLKARTETFAVGVVKFCETLPNTIAGAHELASIFNASLRTARGQRKRQVQVSEASTPSLKIDG